MNQAVHNGYISRPRGCNRFVWQLLLAAHLMKLFYFEVEKRWVACGWLKKWLSDGGGMVAGRGMG